MVYNTLNINLYMDHRIDDYLYQAYKNSNIVEHTLNKESLKNIFKMDKSAVVYQNDFIIFQRSLIEATISFRDWNTNEKKEFEALEILRVNNEVKIKLTDAMITAYNFKKNMDLFLRCNKTISFTNKVKYSII